MANLIQQIVGSLETIPNAINTATGTVAKVDRRVDDVIEAAETYAAASLFLTAIASFSALGLMIIQARQTNCGAGIFTRQPRTEVKMNPRKRKKRRK